MASAKRRTRLRRKERHRPLSSEYFMQFRRFRHRGDFRLQHAVALAGHGNYGLEATGVAGPARRSQPLACAIDHLGGGMSPGPARRNKRLP